MHGITLANFDQLDGEIQNRLNRHLDNNYDRPLFRNSFLNWFKNERVIF